MKTILSIITILFFISCSQNTHDYSGEKYVVETTVRLKDRTANKVLELFKSTNPELVSNESDWIRASFSFNEEFNIVVVHAEWKTKESYLNFSNSAKFKETMSKFRKYFKQKPEVTITKVLFEM